MGLLYCNLGYLRVSVRELGIALNEGNIAQRIDIRNILNGICPVGEVPATSAVGTFRQARYVLPFYPCCPDDIITFQDAAVGQQQLLFMAVIVFYYRVEFDLYT